MYFCPCSCDDPIDGEAEDSSFFVLPRNLSYVQDSYLDRYSVSARYVHNPKIDRCIQHQQGQEWKSNVEDETLGLLSAVTAQDLHGKCDLAFQSVNSSGFVFSRPEFPITSDISNSSTTESTSTWSAVVNSSGFVFSRTDNPISSEASSSTSSTCTRSSVVNSLGLAVSRTDNPTTLEISNSTTTECTSSWSSVTPSSFSSLLHPASIVASKISAFLHSPPNETMDLARDAGTSVDGDHILPSGQVDEASRVDTSSAECPQGLNDDINVDERVTFYTSSHSGESDTEELDSFVSGEDKNNICDNFSCFAATPSCNLKQLSPDNDLLNQLQFDINIDDAPEDAPSHFKEENSRSKYLPYSSAHDNDDDSAIQSFNVEDIFDVQKLDIESDQEAISIDQHISDHSHTDIPQVLNPMDVVFRSYISKEGIIGDRDDSKENIRSQEITQMQFGSPDLDPFIEEGVFVNIDDFDSTNDKSTTVSDASDDTCVSVDSMFLSPDEAELDEESETKHPIHKMSLEEAINRAASDLTKMSLEMYGPGRGLATSDSESIGSLLDVDDDPRFSSLTLKTAGRSSPIRSTKGLKIKITDPTNIESQNLLTDSPTTLTESPIYTEDEFNFSRVQLRKSSSLKSNKTPPGTPHRKKVVRFADAMGLDLESVRHVLNMESPPKIPASALADLMKGIDEENKEVGSRHLCPCFSQPGAAENFSQKIRTQKVSLENAIINDLTITGFIRVANIAYHKNVRIRYTHNAWSTFYDIAASYIQGSCDGPTDRFSFSIVAPPYFGPGSRLEFAVCLIAEGSEYWDNNDGHNYVFECFAKTIPTDSELAWLHFL